MKHRIFIPLFLLRLFTLACDQEDKDISEVYISEDLSWEEEGEYEVRKYLEALDAAYIYLGESFEEDGEEEYQYIYLSIDSSIVTETYTKAQVESLIAKLAGLIYDALYYPIDYEGMQITLSQNEAGGNREYGHITYAREELVNMHPRLY